MFLKQPPRTPVPRKALLDAGSFGNTDQSLPELLSFAFQEFKLWRKRNAVPCSQKRFQEGHIKKKVHGYYFTAKAYNGRIILDFLAERCLEVAQANPGDAKLALVSVAMSLCYNMLYNLQMCFGLTLINPKPKTLNPKPHNICATQPFLEYV